MSTSDHFAAFNAKAEALGWSCRCEPNLAFVRQELNGVAEVWRLKAGTHPIPARSEFDARSLKPVLAHMTLLERLEDGPYRYKLRYHGTSLARYAGDHTGRHIEDLIPPGLADAYIGLYDFVLAEGRPARVLWDYQVPVVAYLKGESFVGPLLSKEGKRTLLLSATFTEAKDSVLRREGRVANGE